MEVKGWRMFVSSGLSSARLYRWFHRIFRQRKTSTFPPASALSPRTPTGKLPSNSIADYCPLIF